jgi:hypothetical protein
MSRSAVVCGCARLLGPLLGCLPRRHSSEVQACSETTPGPGAAPCTPHCTGNTTQGADRAGGGAEAAAQRLQRRGCSAEAAAQRLQRRGCSAEAAALPPRAGFRSGPLATAGDRGCCRGLQGAAAEAGSGPSWFQGLCGGQRRRRGSACNRTLRGVARDGAPCAWLPARGRWCSGAQEAVRPAGAGAGPAAGGQRPARWRVARGGWRVAGGRVVWARRPSVSRACAWCGEARAAVHPLALRPLDSVCWLVLCLQRWPALRTRRPPPASIALKRASPRQSPRGHEHAARSAALLPPRAAPRRRRRHTSPQRARGDPCTQLEHDVPGGGLLRALPVRLRCRGAGGRGAWRRGVARSSGAFASPA